MSAQHDLGPHHQTWGSFVKVSAVCTTTVVVTLALMALFLV